MAHFCSECGSTLLDGAKFCAGCGASVGTPARAARPMGASGAPSSMEKARPFLIGAAVLALLGGGTFWFWQSGNTGPTDLSGNAVESVNQVAPNGSQAALFVVANANIRDKATAQGTQIVGKIARGTRVAGVMEVGVDGLSQWLKLDDGRGYVSAVNLSSNEPPKLIRFMDKAKALTMGASLYALPDESSAMLQTLASGASLQVVGLTEGGFAEVLMPKGGVGYLPPAATSALADKMAGSDTLIRFNPQTCDFGPEMKAYFAKANAAQDAARKAIEAGTYDSEDEKSAALDALDGKSYFAPVNKMFRGLKVTAVGTHYESQSLYFADDRTTVIRVFREAGMTVDDEGNVTGKGGDSPMSASIYASGRDEVAQGKTALGCGV